MIVRKKYKRSDLLISDSELRYRIRTIEQVSKSTPYPTKFQHQDDYIIRCLPMGPRDRFASASVPINDLLAIAEMLDRAFRIGLVHGDIHWKNIVDPAYPTLVDWEPSLLQTTGGAPRLMVTYPWIDHVDRAAGKVTIRTDLMCFVGLLTAKNSSSFRTEKWENAINHALTKDSPFSVMLLKHQR